MPYLAAAVAVVGMLCVLDLILTFGVIRRLREHTTMLNDVTRGMAGPELLAPGDTVGQFTAITTGGEPVSRESLTGPTLVGFFSPGCQPCAEQLPRFVEHAASLPDGPLQALAVIDAEAGQGGDYLEQLTPVARVVMEPHGGPLTAAFSVPGYPVLYLLAHDGAVLASSNAMKDLESAMGRELMRTSSHAT